MYMTRMCLCVCVCVCVCVCAVVYVYVQCAVYGYVGSDTLQLLSKFRSQSGQSCVFLCARVRACLCLIITSRDAVPVLTSAQPHDVRTWIVAFNPTTYNRAIRLSVT